jgi:hypothetical protein
MPNPILVTGAAGLALIGGHPSGEETALRRIKNWGRDMLCPIQEPKWKSWLRKDQP